MRRLWLGLGCALLAGCADLFKPTDDSEPLHVLNALDSTAIAQMKIAMGVWNGDVRDWINVYSQQGRIEALVVVSSRGYSVVFPDTGLEAVKDLKVLVAADTLMISGFSRLSNVKNLFCAGIPPHKLKRWPRGIYRNSGLRMLNLNDQLLANVDDSLVLCKSLALLSVSGNLIDSLPSFIYGGRCSRYRIQ